MFIPTSNTPNLLPFVFRLCSGIINVLIVSIVAMGQTPAPTPSPAPTPITKTGSILVNNPSTVGRISKWVTSSSNGIGTIGDSVIIESALGTIGIGTNPFSDFKLGVDGFTTGGIFASSVNGRGLYGRSSGGDGVFGFSSSGTGTWGASATGVGVRGQSNSNDAIVGSSASGRGAAGFSFNNIGVFGSSTWSTGVMGQSTNSVGLHGFSQNYYGLYAASGTTFAGYFAGTVHATGRLSAGGLLLNSGSFLTFADGTTQSTAATITGVIAGTGLTGGGAAGNVTLGLANGGVNTTQLADSSVTSAKLANASVASNQLADSAVNTNHLVDGSVTTAKIANGQVVKSLNGLMDNVTLAAGDNVTITPSGNSLTISASGTGSQSTYNPLQVAQLRWWGANQSGASFAVGSLPYWVAFDGGSIWVTNANDGSVTKLRASDGANLGTFPVGIGPRAVAFDGKNIWVANFGTESNSVSKLSANDGTLLATIVVGARPWGLAFDGIHMWVSCYQASTVVKIRVSDNQIVGSVSVANPLGLAFDGNNIWAALNLSSGRAVKISGTGSPTVLGEFDAGVFPGFITFDGASIWVSNSGSGNLTKLRATDGSNQGTFPGGGVNNSGATVFDGTNLWVVGGSLLKLRPSDGQVLASFPINGQAIAFDGANLWITDINANTVTKH